MVVVFHGEEGGGGAAQKGQENEGVGEVGDDVDQ